MRKSFPAFSGGKAKGSLQCSDGTKELLAVVDGYRESAQSWRELLQQLKRLGQRVFRAKLSN
jgi:transposase-like protein